MLSNENETSIIDDDGIEIGVNGTVGGFSRVIITKQNMTVRFHDQNGTILYTSSVPPRNLDNSHNNDDENKLDPEYVIIISVSVVSFVLIVLAALYFFFYKPRILSRGSLLGPEGLDDLKAESKHGGTPLLVEESG